MICYTVPIWKSWHQEASIMWLHYFIFVWTYSQKTAKIQNCQVLHFWCHSSTVIWQQNQIYHNLNPTIYPFKQCIIYPKILILWKLIKGESCYKHFGTPCILYYSDILLVITEKPMTFHIIDSIQCGNILRQYSFQDYLKDTVSMANKQNISSTEMWSSFSHDVSSSSWNLKF